MIDRSKQKEMYFKLKDLYKNKKYNTFIKESTKYLESFPNDVIIRFMRVKSYRNLRRFEECIDDLKYILKIENNNEYALTELYYIYYYLNMYEEALELIPVLYEKKCINVYSVSISELVIKKQLGIDIKVKKGARCDYIKEQIINYNEEVAIAHIQEHLNNLKEKESSFKKDIDLVYLFNLIRNNINNEKKINSEEILEVHYFGISNVGFFNEQTCNFIKVIVIPNTNNIITMYPTCQVDYNYVSNIEVDYDKLFKRDNKVKTMSRIDRFNKKYNIV